MLFLYIDPVPRCHWNEGSLSTEAWVWRLYITLHQGRSLTGLKMWQGTILTLKLLGTIILSADLLWLTSLT